MSADWMILDAELRVEQGRFWITGWPDGGYAAKFNRRGTDLWDPVSPEVPDADWPSFAAAQEGCRKYHEALLVTEGARKLSAEMRRESA